MLQSYAKQFARKVFRKFRAMETKVPETGDEILLKAYQRLGIFNYVNDHVSGEAFLLEKIIPNLISKSRPVIFDVGANVGSYTNALLCSLPNAEIHAFEPSPSTYSVLKNSVNSDRVITAMKGMSDECGVAEFFDYENSSSQHASLYSQVLSELHHAKAVRSFEVELTTLDQYCAKENISHIDLIKIDTEGNELKVLQGGKGIIESGGLQIVQFEFNEMNTISRSYLKDFYKLLDGYEFLRLMPAGLLPLGAYSPRNEIFAFQNILAVRSASISAQRIASFITSPLSLPPMTNGR